MDTEYTNNGQLYNDATQTSLVSSAAATFNVLADNTITMTKTVDRPGEYYASGDNITFTITITNTGTLPVNDLFFTDTIDSIVLPVTGNEYTVTATGGTITSLTNPVTVSDIDIGAGGTVVITITGIIA